MLNIRSIPAFADNYIWLIENRDGSCAIVDPGDAKPVLEYLAEHDLDLKVILITHYHHDHVGGVSELRRHYPSACVVGPESESIPCLTHPVNPGQHINLFDCSFEVLDLKGHTAGQVGYLGQRVLFCGDALFSAGCGRVATTMSDMFDTLSLMTRLPDETLVYCAHEYTANNVAFALAVDPENRDLLLYRDEVNHLRAHNQSTIPTSIGQEKKFNPFLRTKEKEIARNVANRSSETTELAIFTALREWKNEF